MLNVQLRDAEGKLEQADENLSEALKISRKNWDAYQMTVTKLEDVEKSANQLCENYKELYQDFNKYVGIASTMREACIQARAALPDAWAAVKCDVPVEVIDLLNKAIKEFDAANAGTPGIRHAEGLSVGEMVDFVNDYGVVFPGKTIMSIEMIDGKPRFHITPWETPWYPAHRRNLFKQSQPGWNYHNDGEHAFFLIEDWRLDVINNYSILGYQEWTEHNLETLLNDIELDGVDGIEVAGCTDQDGIVEVTEETAAQFFSVYTHRTGEGVTCRCDFNIKAHAVSFGIALAIRGNVPVYGNLCSLL